jgi:hypothetical protein
VVQSARVARKSLMIFGDPTWTDYDVRIEALRVTGSDGFGVVVRAAGPQDYLIANFGGAQNRMVGFDTARSGRQTWIPGPPLTLAEGRWYQARVEARGDRYKLYLDGREVFADQVEGHPRGGVGFYCWDTASRFRNITVSDPTGKILFEGLPRIHQLR